MKFGTLLRQPDFGLSRYKATFSLSVRTSIEYVNVIDILCCLEGPSIIVRRRVMVRRVSKHETLSPVFKKYAETLKICADRAQLFRKQNGK